MPSYHALGELAPRDIVARAIFSEIQREQQSNVLLDLSKIKPSVIKTRFPLIYDTCFRYGLDITVQPIPVAPAAHYMMGGIPTDLWGRTDLSGLFAAGEAASTGVHGANRLASNSLLEGLVFGGRIADYLSKQDPTQLPTPSKEMKIHYPHLLTNYGTVASDYSNLNQLTDSYLGINRNAADFSQALAQLNSLSKPDDGFELNPAYFELQNMYLLAGLMFQAALTRNESRGGHFRSDYPTPNTEWRKHISFKNNVISK